MPAKSCSIGQQSLYLLDRWGERVDTDLGSFQYRIANTQVQVVVYATFDQCYDVHSLESVNHDACAC